MRYQFTRICQARVSSAKTLPWRRIRYIVRHRNHREVLVVPEKRRDAGTNTISPYLSTNRAVTCPEIEAARGTSLLSTYPQDLPELGTMSPIIINPYAWQLYQSISTTLFTKYYRFFHTPLSNPGCSKETYQKHNRAYTYILPYNSLIEPPP